MYSRQAEFVGPASAGQAAHVRATHRARRVAHCDIESGPLAAAHSQDMERRWGRGGGAEILVSTNITSGCADSRHLRQ